MMPHPPRSTRTATLVPYSTLFLSHRLDHRLDEAGDLRRGGIGNFGRALAQDRVAHTGDLEYRHASNMRSRSSPVKGRSTTGLVPPRGNALSFPCVPEAVCRRIPASAALPGRRLSTGDGTMAALTFIHATRHEGNVPVVGAKAQPNWPG